MNKYNNCKTWNINGKRMPLPTENKSPRLKENSSVDHPSHYAEGRLYEPIKVIQDWDLDFCLGNTVKYISRAGRKSSAAMSDIEKTIEDLKKAKFYLDYKIKELEGKTGGDVTEQLRQAIKNLGHNPYQE